MAANNLRPIREHYEREGYVSPLRVMSAERANEYRRALEAIQKTYENDPVATGLLTWTAGIVLPFVDEIVRLPSILNPVKEILGEDVLSMAASFFIKEPKSPAFVSWHQDLTYWGYKGVSEVTAWLALTEASRQNGCMWFLPGSQKQKLVDHHDTFEKTNMLSRGQRVNVHVDEADAVAVTLRPGEMSLHHGHMFHSSKPNASPERRIGLAIRYVSPSMFQVSGQRPFAHLVAGNDRYGHFQLLDSPITMMADGDMEKARHAMAMHEETSYNGAVGQGKRTDWR
tara:strand:+ start:66 stop:917 length:852 start_codon:yes stop_codon:yes gene_type:complete